MRVLIVSNLYPPHYIGGYEIRCAQIAGALQQMGHEVQVVTSTYGLPAERASRAPLTETVDGGVVVHRCLNQYAFPPYRTRWPWTFFRARDELADATLFRRLLDQFKPDIVNWWSMYGLSKMLLPMPAGLMIPDVHWIEHWWMIAEYGPRGEIPAAFWETVWDGAWGHPLVRPLLREVGRRWEASVAQRGLPTRTFPNTPSHVCYVSSHMETMHRKAGFQFGSTSIIQGGVPVAEFYRPLEGRDRKPGPLRLLFAGQLTEDRGLNTVVEALGGMNSSERAAVALNVAGLGQRDYEARVRGLVSQFQLDGTVTFLGKVARNAMARTYAEHDVLVFPSMRDEGLPLTMVEAMLSGCAVVSTGSGGAMDVVEAADLPLFPKGDSAALRTILRSFIAGPDQVAVLARRGQRVALDQFSFARMMEKWTHLLARLRPVVARPEI